MVRVEDLEGVIVKVIWLGVVGGRVQISMEVYFVDSSHESLCSCSHWVRPLQVILYPFACPDVPSFC
jgi:hypothetical protein